MWQHWDMIIKGDAVEIVQVEAGEADRGLG
jgi:hypothetical protein